jgi:hypothetical protein
MVSWQKVLKQSPQITTIFDWPDIHTRGTDRGIILVVEVVSVPNINFFRPHRSGIIQRDSQAVVSNRRDDAAPGILEPQHPEDRGMKNAPLVPAEMLSSTTRPASFGYYGLRTARTDGR